MTVEYRGSIEGYSEVFSYVKDAVGEYTVIRPDAFSYSVLAPSTMEFKDLVPLVAKQSFNYSLKARVPPGYTAASVGKRVTRHREDGWETYVFESKLPSWRIDLTVSKFKVLERGDFIVYSLEEDYRYVKEVLEGVEKVFRSLQETFRGSSEVGLLHSNRTSRGLGKSGRCHRHAITERRFLRSSSLRRISRIGTLLERA